MIIDTRDIDIWISKYCIVGRNERDYTAHLFSRFLLHFPLNRGTPYYKKDEARKIFVDHLTRGGFPAVNEGRGVIEGLRYSPSRGIRLYSVDPNKLNAWLNDTCKIGEQHVMRFAALYQQYVLYCGIVSEKPMGRTYFTKAIQLKGFEYKKTARGIYVLGITSSVNRLTHLT